MSRKKLIVDNAWRLPDIPKRVLVKIGNKYYLVVPEFPITTMENAREVSEQWIDERALKDNEFWDYEYIVYGIEKKNGYNVKVGRCIRGFKDASHSGSSNLLLTVGGAEAPPPKKAKDRRLRI